MICRNKERNKVKVVLLALNAKYIHTSLALRYIKTYCKEYEEHIDLIETSINNNENEIIKQLYNKKPDILGISCYIWNMNDIKTLIPTIKKILPDTTIILGGPEVSYDGEALLKECQADIVMQGEGEETWKEYLDYRIKGIGSLEKINGLIYHDQDANIHKNNPRMPLNLENLPFVYDDDLSDLANKIIYYEASRGCPFSCQYCLSSIEHGVRFVPIERVKAHMQFFLDHKVKQVKFVDRTFNTRKDYAMSIWQYLIAHDNGVTNFHFEIAAELIVEEMYPLLEKARPGLIQFEIGVQSTNPTVLKLIQRPMPFEDIKKVVLRIKAMNNIRQHLDLIAGLPEEDYRSFEKSFNDVMSIRPEQFQLGFLKLLKGSGLRNKAEEYGLIYKEEPPYEILYTKHISFAEILRLHSIDDLVDRYYNSGRFSRTLDYLFEAIGTPFKCFEKLSIFWEHKGFDMIDHSKMAYYFHLQAFCEEEAQNSNIDPILTKELLRFDYLLNEPFNEVPTILETIERPVLKGVYNALIKDDEWIKVHSDALIQYIPRQRYRLTHLDAFYYADYLLDVKTTPKQSQTPKKLLFDYTQKEVSYYVVDKEYSDETTRAN